MTVSLSYDVAKLIELHTFTIEVVPFVVAGGVGAMIAMSKLSNDF
jgi:hypothetical protein